ncbi:alpha-hydroxy acid oxidase [Rhodococcus rhodochrous]|uniref:alpha-hydroxy acid oxidase n=1 Tax=Rhodococcus rhodochrous TaxID=1829 RepID=UPI00031935CE|nr:alpha-hydroxy acid oxidase [Rhodococcus rhodochrous]
MSKRQRPLDSIADAERRAKKRLPAPLYLRYSGATEAEVTSRDNVQAFNEVFLHPRAAARPFEVDVSVKLFDQQLALPVVLAPVGGIYAVHADGELGAARAAAAAGTAIGVSALSSKPVERVIEANANTWFQLVFNGGRDRIAQTIELARNAGCSALVVTVDHTGGGLKPDRPRMPDLPRTLNIRTMLPFAPYGALRPRWAFDFLRAGLNVSAPNLRRADGTVPTILEAMADVSKTKSASWDDLAWLRSVWQGPLIIKGVTTFEDTRRAIGIGADAVSVSNHGGLALDGSPGTLRTLPEVVAAAGEEIVVLMDGGIRRGSDVVKALAFGARAVLIGRPYVWGLATSGEQGVAEVLEILRLGIVKTMEALGKSSVAELDRTCLFQPPVPGV